jgi:hypothetical protein
MVEHEEDAISAGAGRSGKFDRRKPASAGEGGFRTNGGTTPLVLLENEVKVTL